eukprot:1940709-Rhodomonas_salina.1
MCSERLADAKFLKSAQTSITISLRSEVDTEAESRRISTHSLQGGRSCAVACELVSSSAGRCGGSGICCSGRHRVGCGRDGRKESGTCRSYV